MHSQDSLILAARDKRSPHFLETLNGIGCTMNRGYSNQLLFPKYCPLCADGAYLCLGSSCMGAKKIPQTTPSLTPLVPPYNSIPGLVTKKTKEEPNHKAKVLQNKTSYILI